ncbi:MAG: hypothetical protein QHH25_04110 [Candidatus Acetothermia bacterium]|nr:hypothetical protein [Candidatus Acetothermia bacterium]
MICLVASSPLAAQVDVETDFGFNGYYHPDCPTPIWITLQSRGPALQGQIIIAQEVKSPWQGATEERLILPFELAGRTKKRFSLTFLVRGYIYPLSITVLAGGQVVHEQEISLKGRFSEEPLTLALGDSPFPNALPSGELPLQIEPESLPSEWPGLAGVRRIYLARLNPAGLSRPQWEALVRWIEWGGELVVLGGDNWYFQDTPALRELIPFAPTGLGEREGRPVVLGEPRGEVLYQEGSAILVAAARGRGRVLFSTVNPLTDPVDEAFWKALSGEEKGASVDHEAPRLAGELLSQLRLPFPSKLTLIGIYSLYLGGLALFGWAALHRPRWSPLVLLWVAGVMVLTARYLDRPEFAKPLLGLELDLFHDLGGATVHSAWLGLFAKAGAELEVEAEIADGQLEQALPEERGDHLYDLIFLREEDKLRALFKMEAWQARSLYLERMSGDLASLRVAGGRAIAKNLTPLSLSDCLVLLGGKAFLFGDLGPHETTEREVGPEARWPTEPVRAQLYAKAREGLRGERALLCRCAPPGTFSQAAAEERQAACIVAIEEDA